MSRINLFGLVLLLAVFAAASWRMTSRAWRGSAAAEGNTVVLRFAHAAIHPGIMRANEEAIRDYESLHPGVRVEQVPVPLRVWPAWLRTQMVGGTAPDLAEMDRGQPDEFLARFFVPFEPWLDAPNPYNAGTPLEGVPWRDTFVDGLANAPAYRPGLQQVLGIPMTVATVRVFANAELMRTITGDAKAPANYAEFMRLCEEVKAYSSRTGRPLVALAGSLTHMQPVLGSLFSSQTQRLARELDSRGTLEFGSREAALAYLRGEWNWRTPTVADGLTLMREVGRQTVEGFVQMQREDGVFHYSQGRALMMVTGSWEADTIISNSDFEQIMFPIPIPSSNDARYGRNVLGPGSELALSPGNAVGIARTSRHKDAAVDFLRFLTSRRVSERVMADSNRLSATVGVQPSERIRAFAPRIEGFLPGFGPEFGGLGGRSAEANRIYGVLLHELVSGPGSVEAFTRGVEERFAEAITTDLNSVVAESVKTSRQEDAVIAVAHLALAADPDEGVRFARMQESQALRELEEAQTRHVLARARR